MPFNQPAADDRHRQRRERLQHLRNEFSDMVNYYWESFPTSSEREGELEYRIGEKLRYIQREIDTFIRDFKEAPNE